MNERKIIRKTDYTKHAFVIVAIYVHVANEMCLVEQTF